MQWKNVYSNVKSLENNDIASVLLSFFIYQSVQANGDFITAEHKLLRMREINRVTKEKYEDELGWGPKLPYGEDSLNHAMKEVEDARKNFAEAEAFLNFVKDKILQNAKF